MILKVIELKQARSIWVKCLVESITSEKNSSFTKHYRNIKCQKPRLRSSLFCFYGIFFWFLKAINYRDLIWGNPDVVTWTQPAITCSKLTIETLEQGVKLWTCFTPCSIVSIVNFEHVIAGWDTCVKTSF